MVLDTSALLVLLNNEPAAEAFRAAVEADLIRLVSTATLVETSIVIESRVGEAGGRELDLLIHTASIQVVAVDAEQAEVARRAFWQFGKGRHAAGLNYGDCFSYALSKTSAEPLLYQGEDFRRTDVASVIVEP
jgi:ribonuclease VapC